MVDRAGFEPATSRLQTGRSASELPAPLQLLKIKEKPLYAFLHHKTTVERALLYYSRSQQLMEIPITSHDKQQVKEIIRKIYKMIQTEEPPKVKPNPKQCQDCGYQPYCQPKTQPRKAPYLS